MDHQLDAREAREPGRCRLLLGLLTTYVARKAEVREEAQRLHVRRGPAY